MKRPVEVTNWHRGGIGLVGLLTGASWLMAIGFDMKFLFVAFGLSLLMICLVPIMVSKSYDWFSPWTAVLIAILYGATFPAVCMSFDLPSKEFLDRETFLGQPPDFFIWPSLILLASFLCIAIGYFAWPPSRPNADTSFTRVSNPSRLLTICLICGVFTVTAFSAYFLMNGSFAGGLSAKRAGLNTLDVGADQSYRSHGYLRHLAKLGNIALLLLAAHWCRYQASNRSAMSLLRAVLMGALLVVSIALPFYASSRAGMMWVIFSLACTIYYMRKSVITVRSVGLVGMFLVAIFFVTIVRNGGLDDSSETKQRISLLFLNRHAPDVASNAHIIRAIPQTLDYQYGKTISAWFLAPIPRELMPNKPLVHMGPIIGERVYKLGLNGIPTGVTADLYWNFHLVGVFFGSLFMGFYLRASYELTMRVKIDPVLLAPIYAFAIFPIGFKMAGLGLGHGLVMPLVDLVTVSMVVWLASVPARHWSPDSQLPDQPPVIGNPVVPQ